MSDENPSMPSAMQHWLAAISDDLERRKRDHLYRTLLPVSSAQGAELTIGGKSYAQFCTNNYLGLAADPEVVDAARLALDRWGWGSSAARLVAGSMEAHHQLEMELAEFKHAEAALVFTSGYAANMAVLTTFAGPQDLILSDKLNHASLLDAANASGARCRTFNHRNYQRLKSLLERQRGDVMGILGDDGLLEKEQTHAQLERDRHENYDSAGRAWIVSDTVFSMDGDVADMVELARIAGRHNALLITDEAHATGVLGPDGRGVAALAGVENSVAVSVGTLSKAFGSVGGFVTGPRPVIDALVNCARQFIYTTALPAACSAAALAALLISRREPRRRQRVMALAEHVRTELTVAGYQTGDSQSPIIPVMLGSAGRAVQASNWLKEQGLYIPAIRPPTVPQKSARLRISLMATHTDSQIEQLLTAMKKLRDHLPSDDS